MRCFALGCKGTDSQLFQLFYSLIMDLFLHEVSCSHRKKKSILSMLRYCSDSCRRPDYPRIEKSQLEMSDSTPLHLFKKIMAPHLQQPCAAGWRTLRAGWDSDMQLKTCDPDHGLSTWFGAVFPDYHDGPAPGHGSARRSEIGQLDSDSNSDPGRPAVTGLMTRTRAGARAVGWSESAGFWLLARGPLWPTVAFRRGALALAATAAVQD